MCSFLLFPSSFFSHDKPLTICIDTIEPFPAMLIDVSSESTVRMMHLIAELRWGFPLICAYSAVTFSHTGQTDEIKSIQAYHEAACRPGKWQPANRSPAGMSPTTRQEQGRQLLFLKRGSYNVCGLVRNHQHGEAWDWPRLVKCAQATVSRYGPFSPGSCLMLDGEHVDSSSRLISMNVHVRFVV